MTEDGYPTEEELEIIKNWDLTKKSVTELLDFVYQIWWTPDWGYRLTGKHILKLELHTGGWSGNELIIRSLKENLFFWPMYYTQHRAGGHYYFKMNLKTRKNEVQV